LLVDDNDDLWIEKRVVVMQRVGRITSYLILLDRAALRIFKNLDHPPPAVPV
jgi:hypothetical protein